MYETFPSKSAPVNPSEQTGQTSPGLKSTKTGQYTQTFPGKGGNPFKLKDTPTPQGGTETFPKSGQKGSRPGTDITDGHVKKGGFNLSATAKAQ